MNKNERHIVRPPFTLFFFILLIFFIPFIALAATPKEELEQTQKDMERERERQSAIVDKADALQKELQAIQDKLVITAEAMQKAEAELTDSEDKLHILTEELQIKNDTFKIQQQHLAALLIAELSLSKTPPEAMLMMPGDPMDIMKAARALGMTSESIREESQSLRLQMQELQKLKDKVAERHNHLLSAQAVLTKQHHELVSQLADRKALQRQLGNQQKQASETLAHLAQKASDLRDLVSGLKEEEGKKEDTETRSVNPSAKAGNSHLRSFVKAKGHIRTPVAGRLIQSFGAAQGKNTTSKGITIAARKGAEVTAPYDGEVVFSGPFLNYGRMIILRHSDDFHTLLAGLTKIDVNVGQFLLEGEPIGAMGSSDSENADDQKLYIELRKNNQPVDPSLWINGLKKK